MLIPGKLYRPTITISFSETENDSYWYKQDIILSENDIFMLVSWDHISRPTTEDTLIKILYNNMFFWRRAREYNINRWFCRI